MSQAAPFVHVHIEGKDFSDRVTRFRYVDSTEQDNVAKVTIELRSAEDLDDEVLVSGSAMKVQFGLLEGNMSEPVFLKMREPEPIFEGTVKVKLRAYDKGVDMKATESQREWKNKRSSEIAQEIAIEYGLEPEVDETEHVYKSIPQGNKTDYELLQYLASKEDDRLFYIKGGKLKFVKVDFDKDPVGRFDYEDDRLLSFRPKVRDMTGDKGKDGTRAITVDPVTGETVEEEGSDRDKSGLGKIRYNSNSEVIGHVQSEGTKEKEGRSGKNIPVPSKEQAKETADQNMKRAGRTDGVTADMTIEGEPHLEADDLVTLSGLSKRYSGNWYIRSIEHPIEGGTYESQLVLGRNAANKNVRKGEGEGTTDPNEKRGEKNSEKKKELGEYDEDGNPRNKPAEEQYYGPDE